MKRTATIVLLFLSLTAALTWISLLSAKASPYIDPYLAKSWSTASSTSTVEVVVTLDHIPTVADAQAIEGYSIGSVAMDHLPMVMAVTTYGSLSNIASFPGVVSLFQNRPVAYFGDVKTVTHTIGEVPVQHSWWNDIMHVPDVWNLGFQGQGVTVAVVDSGVDATNPSLGYSFPNGLSQAPFRVVQNVKVLTVGELLSTQEQHPPFGPDQLYVENVPNTDTTGGHGTSVSGTIAGTGDGSSGMYKGAAPKSNILGLGAGETLVIFHIIASYNYILGHQDQYHIKAVNNSWGSDFECSLLVGGVLPEPDACRGLTPINVSTKQAHDAGIAVFFAAGNDGPGHPTINPFSEPSWVISVGAGTQSGGLSEFSSRGCSDNSDPICANPAEQQPDLVAPGVNVVTTKAKTGATDASLDQTTDLGNIVTPLWVDYTTFAGTSCASPMAAGVGALVLSAANISPDQLKAAMKQSADPMLGYLPYQAGTGYTNALGAARAALGKGFKPTTIKTQDFGDQRFVYPGFIGGAFAVASDEMSANFPAFQGASSVSVNASFPQPSLRNQWRLNVYGPAGDQLVQKNAAVGSTSVAFAVNNATLIASLNNPGFTSGTWTVRIINFDLGSQVKLTVDVIYPTKASSALKTGQIVHVNDSGSNSVSGTQEALFETYGGVVTGTQVLSTGGTSVSADLTASNGALISLVQIIVVDSSGNVIESRGAFVMTQADLNTRAQQIQQQLPTTTNLAQVAALQNELALIQAALPTAPVTEDMPLLAL